MSPRLLRVLLAGLVALGVPLASAAPATAATSGHARTVLSGWSQLPSQVGRGAVVRARLTVSGGVRTVHLQRLSGKRWKDTTKGRSGRSGQVRLTLPTSKDALLVLRVRVDATKRASALTSGKRTVRVVDPAALPPSSGSGSGDGSGDGSGEPILIVPPDPPLPTPAEQQAMLDQELVLINQARAQQQDCDGTIMPPVPALRRDPTIDAVSAAYATRMATEDFFAHVAPDGSDPVSRLKAGGIVSNAYGENIGGGYRDAAEVVAGWLHSPSHCVNLMHDFYTRIGMGVATSTTAHYPLYWVQNFAGEQKQPQ